MIFAALSRLLERSYDTATLENPKDWLRDVNGGRVHTLAGTNVSDVNQLDISVNFACISLIAEIMASLRPTLYRERKSGGKDVATDNPLYDVLYLKPNKENTAYTHRNVSTTHLALFGNRFDQIVRDGRGRIRELWPIVPIEDRIKKLRNPDTMDIQYRVRVNGRDEILPADEILHVPGFSKTGFLGQSNASLQRLRLGISKALDEYEARFFGQGFMPSMVGEYGGSTGAAFIKNPVQHAKVEKLKEDYAGLAKAHGIMIAEGGIKIKPIENRLDWSMLDQRQQAAAIAICGMWRVPPSLVGILYWATFSNITHLDLQFGKYCIHPWVRREEDSLNCWLLTDAQRRAGYKIEYPVEEIYRTDIETLSKALKEQWDRGVISSDEWREKLGRNPKSKFGEQYYVPMNYVPEGTPIEPKESTEREMNVIPLKRSDDEAV
jgi:HK97 family phage portal protein